MDQHQYYELWIRYLEMIQRIVERMSDHGAKVKNYCITVSVALSSISLTVGTPIPLFISFIGTILFGALDAKYLKKEGEFRLLYEDVASKDWSTKPDFSLKAPRKTVVSYFSVFFSWSVFSFYFMVAFTPLMAVSIISFLPKLPHF